MDPLEHAISSASGGRFDAADRALRALPPRAHSWFAAWLAAARGEFAASEKLARRLLSVADDEYAARAGITLGSVLRQTGRHAEARRADEQALAIATVPVRRAHAHIGLAADSVGLTDLDGVVAHLTHAAALAPRGDWRVWTRVHWVRCELALMDDRPAAAVRAAEAAVVRASVVRATRHEAKSQLFLGAALAAARDRSGSVRALRRAEQLSRRVDARPIHAVAVEMLEAGARRFPGRR